MRIGQWLFFFQVVVMLVLSSCAGTRPGQGDGLEQISTGYGVQDKRTTTGAAGSVKVNNAFTSAMDLADVLRRMAGVRVQGQGDNIRVFLRGTSSGIESQEPLFVVDGSMVGNSYRAVSALSVADIDRVTVLRDLSSTNIYGGNGENGVIVIEMKKR